MKKVAFSYHDFIVSARNCMFTDDQVDFLWDIFAELKPDPKDFKKPNV